MSANLQINPQLTTVSKGLFTGASTNGLVQGTAYPDPATRYALRTGILDSAESLPMWGGVAITELVPYRAANAVAPSANLGVKVQRATTVTGGSKPINGFSVFDQAYGMINSPQSPVPLASPGGQVMSYRLGSGARIAVACDPVLISLAGTPISSAVNWDFVNQRLVPATGAITIAATGSSYNSTTGLVTLALSSAANLSPGDSVIVSGATGTGADLALVNGTYTTTTGTGGSTIVYQIATGKTITTITGGSLTTGGTALPVTVLETHPSNCMVVTYDAVNGWGTWNYDGAAALIQI